MHVCQCLPSIQLRRHRDVVSLIFSNFLDQELAQLIKIINRTD